MEDNSQESWTSSLGRYRDGAGNGKNYSYRRCNCHRCAAVGHMDSNPHGAAKGGTEVPHPPAAGAANGGGGKPQPCQRGEGEETDTCRGWGQAVSTVSWRCTACCVLYKSHHAVRRPRYPSIHKYY
jgi:hypothetical protein